MKKIFNIFILIFAFANANVMAQQTACCPEFELAFKRDFDCTREGPCFSPLAGNQSGYTASNCKYSTNTFLVVPNLPGYSFVWVVTGGIPSSTTTNPINITWGGGGTGTIMVTITSADGSCVKTIKEKICLRDAPIAGFTFNPNGACTGFPILFTNTSVGAAGVYWDFGDGSFAGNVNSVTHSYAFLGVYTVTIYATNDTTPCVQSAPGGGKPCCGCTSSYTLKVTVVAGSPLTILPKNCINPCLCTGDTSEYCLSAPCTPPYNWTVTGGNIIAGLGTQCIKVKWTGPYPTTVSISAPNCGNPCGNTATLSVPVLVSGIPILPNTSPVCQNSTQTYSLPAMPGVFYNWTVTGGIIAGPNTNTSSITVLWGPGPTGQVSCTYQNPLKKNCSGSSVLNITIKPVLKIIGPSQSCVGCTAFFMTMGGTNVTWTGSAGLVFSPVNGLNTTVSFPNSAVTNTYTITATDPTVCNSPLSTFIVVAPRPVLTISPLTASACPNTQLKFVATSTISTSPISWVLPAGATMVANTGTQLDTAVIKFGPIPNTGVTVTATQNCAFNLTCSQATASATVNKPPAPILSSPIINPCIDQTVSYSISNYIPGIYYTWTIASNLGTIISGQGMGTITVLWHGNLTVNNQAFLTVSNCSGSAQVLITVKLPVPPTITKTGSCFPFTLTSSTAGPYLWSGPGVTGQTTQSVIITQPGTYSVTITGLPGSCAPTTTIIVPPNPYFVKISPPCTVSSCNPATLSVVLTVSTNIPSPTNCQWLYQPPGGGPFTVVSTTCGNYTATLLGTYYMVITDPNGCKDTSNYIRIPQDINICCASAACNSLPPNVIDFTHTGCNPTIFTGIFTLPPGWSTGSLPVTYCFGDGTSQTGPSLNATHQYPAANLYHACIIRKIYKPSGVGGVNDTCCVSNCHDVIIPVVAHFTASYNCNTGILTIVDNSSYYPNNTGAVISWNYTGTYTGSFINLPNLTQTITPTNSGTFAITLTATLNGCASTYSMPILIVLPAAPITITPNPTCDGSPVFFSTTAGMISYNWQFGDNNFSYAASPQHIYPGPGTYNVTLTVTTPQGCVIVKTGSVIVQPKPIVTLSPNPVTICPGTSVTLTATIINQNGNTMCPGLANYNFQWYNNGNPVGGNTPTLNATTYGNYYAVLTGNTPGCNCVITTDTATVNWYPKPVAKIKGSSTVCLNFGTGSVTLSNAVSGYTTYNWSSNNPPAITFSPNNVYSTLVTITAAGNFQIFLEVIDANGCKAYDTLCIYATNSPTVNITSPAGTLCAGKVYALTAVPTPATAPPAGYGYLWNNGAITTSINVSAPGAYSVTLTDMNTGCSVTSNPVLINQGPDLRLFPSCCDTICDNAPINIIPPLPLAPGQNVCSVYNIVWLDNNVPVSPQPSPCNILNTATLTPLLGLHKISIVVTINGCTDTSNVFNLFIKHCDSCDCKGSHWGEISLTPGNNAAPNGNVVIGNPIIIKCKNNYTLNCNQPYTINASFICKDSSCPGKVTYSLQPPIGSPITGNVPATFTPTQNGVYILTLYGWCGGKKCDSCIIDLTVKCDSCDCKGSHWGEMTVSDGVKTTNINCGKTYDWKCKTPFTVNATFNCSKPACAGAVTYTLIPPSGPSVSGNVPLTYTPVQSGTYTVVLYGMCGGKVCDSCVIKFKVDCPPEPCCPYNITVKDPTVQLSTISNPGATVANANFPITGPTGNLFTEIRAEVMSYNLFSNFNNECLSCKSYPFTWASIYQAGNVGAIPPKITMYNSTVTSFNPSGNGMYQNPREVIWNSTNPFALPNNINIQFLLPPASIIDCCELTAKICVKFTFRDKDCKECEVIVCFTVVIKPGGGHNDDKACNCSIKPVFKYESNGGQSGSKTVSCGDVIDLFAGSIFASVLPNFTCQDQNGKDCPGSSITVSITKPDNSTQVLAGPNYNYTYTLGMSGIFEYTLSGTCGGKQCECKFKVKIP